jgi:ubiquinone/menaquinone biosynthesis C-methylase UbiE
LILTQTTSSYGALNLLTIATFSSDSFSFKYSSCILRNVGMPSQSKFWDRMAARYAKTPVPDEAIYQEKLARTRKLFTSHSRVLEFGCGTGSTAIAHATHVQHIDALDFSSNMLAIAQQKADVAGVNNLTFHQTSLRECDASMIAYDVLLALSILHLLPELELELEEINRRLQPGGYFVSSSACIAELPWFIKCILPTLGAVGLIPRLNIFKAVDLKQSIVDAGFVIEDFWQPAKGKAVFIIARKPI